MQPMFFDGVWKKFDELAEAELAQPAASTRTAPSRSAFTRASYSAPPRAGGNPAG
jgi:hypothetical protein